MAETRIYRIKNKADGKVRLVEATHPSNALRHVAQASFEVSVAKPADVVYAYEHGAKVEQVKPEQLSLPETSEGQQA